MKYFPMLCKKAGEEVLNSSSHLFEPKLDGTRCIAEINEKVKLLNRRRRNIARRYPLISKELKKFKNCIFDGEIVCYNENGLPDFYLLQKREIESPFMVELRAKIIPATYVIFDILEKNGKSVIEMPLEERKEMLNGIKDEHIECIFYTENGKKLWEEVKKRNIEGVIAKEKGSKYYPGERRKEWVKIKNLKSIDVVIVGYTTFKREISSLAMALYKNDKLYYIGKVGTGFEKETIEYLLKKIEESDKPVVANPEKASQVIWVKPYFVAEVKYLEKTKDNELRTPSLIRLREDKPVEECTFEQI